MHKRALRRLLTFQPMLASAPRGHRVESTQRATSRDNNSDDYDNDEQREKAVRTKRPKAAWSAKRQDLEERLVEKNKLSKTTKRKSMSTSKEGESYEEEEDEMETKEIVHKREAIEAHKGRKAAPMIVKDKEAESGEVLRWGQ